MAKPKNDSTPPADTSATAQAGTQDTPAPNAEDQRVARQREQALADSLDQVSQRLTHAEARANAAEGELKKERAAREAADQKVLQLERDLARANTAAATAGEAIEGLPEGAVQVKESVTIASLSRGGNQPRRAHPKKGDVLLVGSDDDVDGLQRELGSRCTVYRVSRETVTDLGKSGFLLGS